MRRLSGVRILVDGDENCWGRILTLLVTPKGVLAEGTRFLGVLERYRRLGGYFFASKK